MQAEVCPSCGAENPPTSKFCNNCGAQLEPTRGTSATSTPVEKPKKRRGWLLIAGAIVAVCVVVAIFAALVAPPGEEALPTSSAVVQTTQPVEVTEAEQPTEPPAPSDTPIPTETPVPTDTPIPTETPVPTDTATPTPEPEPIVLSGTGQYVTDELMLPSSISVASFTHSGSSNFIVEVYLGDDTELLINTIGRYSGSRPIVGADPVILAIDADGAWTVQIKPIGITDTPAFSGKGDAASGAFVPPARGAWNVSHDGEHNFIVILHCAGGSDLVQNEIGAVSGSVMMAFPEGPCLWEIQADGNWVLAPRE